MNQRLREAVNLLKDQRKVRSDAECANDLGIDKADLSRMMSGKRPISQRFVGSFVRHFPEINEEWLRTGEGEMLKIASAVAENHSISIAGDDVRANNIHMNSDETIAKLIDEVSAQRRLTEIALQQNSDLIAILAKGCNK